ncbi:MAG: bifunctional 5,10-methylenetetrahydrofolate dehydrogenase/5,10-methenyltetrahydrofolate cyclohydrolase [Synergistes sp.]|nr:bifunctional 5,10-methylenetetrahydrofolate dehydrogenase/5,10-methenyltetrahydrofolate cyclohydrolase [Synergistes sp.]
MTEILKGKPVIDKLNVRLKCECEELKKSGLYPTIAIVRVGENADDITYERSAEKCCCEAGVRVRKFTFGESISQDEFLSCIQRINNDKDIHGALILRPLPQHIDDRTVCRTLSPDKDIDGITEYSMAGVYSDKPVGFAPCTAEACIDMLEHYGIEIAGKRAVVVGRSFVVGKPAAMMLLKRNATVTICHTKTKNLAQICRSADILVVAIGHAKMITSEYLSEGQTIIDIGINVDENGKICGDVDSKSAEGLAHAITPVPGGIGRITTAVLAKHAVEACRRLSCK